MKPAVFLDRDGTIIELVHHLRDPVDVRLIPGAGEAIARLRAAGWLVVVVTNQSVIGRGLLTPAGLETVHTEMRQQLSAFHTDVDAIYYSPHAPLQKDPTVIEHQMRKPGPGMLLLAADEMSLDLGLSWMVGDTVSDILAGEHAGCQTILVKTGYGLKFSHDHVNVTYIARDIEQAAAHILASEMRSNIS